MTLIGKRIAIAFLLLQPLYLKAQELIPLHQWRVHLSYNEVVDLDKIDNRIVAAAKEGIFFFNIADGEITTLTSLDGIHPSEITAIGYDEVNNLLFIGHSSGMIDMVSKDAVVRLDNLHNDYRNEKRVNDFYFSGNKVFISTQPGLLIYDISEKRFTATYDGLGSEGDDVPVNEVVIYNNKIVAATGEGVIAGPLTATNLNDFRMWERFNELPVAESVALAISGEYLFAALNNEDIYRWDGSTWTATGWLPGEQFNALTANGNELVITTTGAVYSVINEELTVLPSDKVISPAYAFKDQNGLWVADKTLGLINAGRGEVIKASGPEYDINRMEVVNNTLYGLPGKIDAATGFSAFEKGAWVNYSELNANERYKIPVFRHAYDVAAFQERLYVSSFSDGLLMIDGNSREIWNAYTPAAPFQGFNGRTYITGLAVTQAGLWIANYGASTSLHLYNGQGFQSYTLENPFVLDIMVAPNGFLVMPLEGNGLLIFNPETGEQRILNTGEAGGNLPDGSINDVVFDLAGRMWVATQSGVVYFNNAQSLFDSNLQAVVPVYNSRNLFRNRNVTSIAVDGGGRKWFGTTEGAWLFNKDLTEEIFYFNEENSPLLSERVGDIILIQDTGEVFFATPEGVASFRSAASTPARPLNEVKVFPNPVMAEFQGTVGITGIAADANVKITDVSGNLIFQTTANGSTASWNLLNHRGEKVPSGVYLIFTAKQDGSESLVGKVAVVR